MKLPIVRNILIGVVILFAIAFQYIWLKDLLFIIFIIYLLKQKEINKFSKFVLSFEIYLLTLLVINIFLWLFWIKESITTIYQDWLFILSFSFGSINPIDLDFFNLDSRLSLLISILLFVIILLIVIWLIKRGVIKTGRKIHLIFIIIILPFLLIQLISYLFLLKFLLSNSFK